MKPLLGVQHDADAHWVGNGFPVRASVARSKQDHVEAGAVIPASHAAITREGFARRHSVRHVERSGDRSTAGADLNGDGRPDIAASGRSTHNPVIDGNTTTMKK